PTMDWLGKREQSFATCCRDARLDWRPERTTRSVLVRDPICRRGYVACIRHANSMPGQATDLRPRIRRVRMTPATLRGRRVAKRIPAAAVTPAGIARASCGRQSRIDEKRGGAQCP